VVGIKGDKGAIVEKIKKYGRKGNTKKRSG